MPSLSSQLDSFHRQHLSYHRIDVNRSRVEHLFDAPTPLPQRRMPRSALNSRTAAPTAYA
jgi:hypothetical protein